MGTEKRQRQKEGRASRIAAAEAAKKKADQRSLLLRVLMGAAVIAVVIGVMFVFGGDDEGTDTASASSTTADPLSTLETDPPMPSAAGLPCVAQADPPAEGEPAVPVKEGDPPTTLIKEDITVGTGEAVTDPTQTVTVNYVGVACSTGVKFDSSYERGEPATFPLNGVITGWTEGLVGMQVGGQRLLGIPAEMAYGPTGSPPDIAPDEPLWFVVELVSIDAATGDPTATGDTTATTAATGDTTASSETTATTAASTTSTTAD